MDEPRAVALVSDDLLFASRLETTVRGSGGTLRRSPGPAVPEADTVFVDLNRDSGHRLGLIGLLREQRPGATIIGFCHHEQDSVRIAAMRAGADQVITNGALQAVALRLAGRAGG